MSTNTNAIKITKAQLIRSGFNNYEVSYWSYLYHFRIYNTEMNKFYKYKFVISFTGEDLDDYRYNEEEDSYDDCKPRDYADELAFSFLDSYNATFDNHKRLYEACTNSIISYNRKVA